MRIQIMKILLLAFMSCMLNDKNIYSNEQFECVLSLLE